MRRKKPKLSKKAEAMIALGSEMMSSALKQGGVPEILIAAKPGNEGPSHLEYFIVSPLKTHEIRYVLSRVLGLLDGSIEENN